MQSLPLALQVEEGEFGELSYAAHRRDHFVFSQPGNLPSNPHQIPLSLLDVLILFCCL